MLTSSSYTTFDNISSPKPPDDKHSGPYYCIKIVLILLLLIFWIGIINAETIYKAGHPSFLCFCQLSDTHIYDISEENKFTPSFLTLYKKRISSILGETETSLRNAVEEINRRRPDFVVVTGDLIDFYSKRNINRFKNIISEIKVPYYLCLGNHDVQSLSLKEDNDSHFIWGNSSRATILKDLKMQRSYYSFDYSFSNIICHFVVIDSTLEGEDTGGIEDFAQLKWLDKDLSFASDRPAVLFFHHPLPVRGFSYLGPVSILAKNNDKLFDIINKHQNIISIFCGHIHQPCIGRFIQGYPFQIAMYATLNQREGASRFITINEEGMRIEPENYYIPIPKDLNRVVHNYEKAEMPFIDFKEDYSPWHVLDEESQGMQEIHQEFLLIKGKEASYFSGSLGHRICFPGKKISGIMFDFETNYDNSEVIYELIDEQGKQLWSQNTYGLYHGGEILNDLDTTALTFRLRSKVKGKSVVGWRGSAKDITIYLK